MEDERTEIDTIETLARTFAPDIITRSQWASLYRSDNQWCKDPYFRMAAEGVLKQCLQDCKDNNYPRRLRLIEEIRWWISEEGCREAVYKFSTVIEAVESVLQGLTVESARERFSLMCDRAEQQARQAMGGNYGNSCSEPQHGQQRQYLHHAVSASHHAPGDHGLRERKDQGR